MSPPSAFARVTGRSWSLLLTSSPMGALNRFLNQVQRAVVVTCVVTRRWLRAGHQSNRELPPITDSILVVRPDIQ